MDSKSFRRNIGMVVFCIFLNTLGKLIRRGGNLRSGIFYGPLGRSHIGSGGKPAFFHADRRQVDIHDCECIYWNLILRLCAQRLS